MKGILKNIDKSLTLLAIRSHFISIESSKHLVLTILLWSNLQEARVYMNGPQTYEYAPVTFAENNTPKIYPRFYSPTSWHVWVIQYQSWTSRPKDVDEDLQMIQPRPKEVGNLKCSTLDIMSYVMSYFEKVKLSPKTLKSHLINILYN